MRIVNCAAMFALSVVAVTSQAAEPDQRTGLVEAFESVDGWQPGRDPDQPDSKFAPRELKSEEGRLVIDTPLGTLAQIPDDYFNKRGIRPHPYPVWLSKRYGEVDIDVYPYLVARMSRSQCFTLLRVNDQDTKVLHTTGLHVQDLRDAGLQGKQPIVLQILIGSTSGRVILDDIRLVSELTDQEKDALIPRGYTVRPQGLECEPFERVNDNLILENTFHHRGADPRSVYLVTAVENSRLESRFSAPGMLPERPRDDAVCVFLEAEEAQATLPISTRRAGASRPICYSTSTGSRSKRRRHRKDAISRGVWSRAPSHLRRMTIV